jgi:NAD(P)-dependent dehydrogenase (short-subunit alcohol dehydrogenase family)
MANLEFSGRTALVSGAGAGIGRACARSFARNGAAVAVADINASDAAETVNLIRAEGGIAEAFQCDATKHLEVERLCSAILDRFGSIDILHNNVGSSRGSCIEDVSESDYEFTIDTTFRSVFLGLKHVLPIMRRQGGGVVVNTASMSGMSTEATANIVYAAAKAGVIHMTAYAARNYAAHNIRVNCIAPGGVSTKIVNELFTPEEQSALAARLQLIPRMIRPEEIAAMVIYLCSSNATMMTGVTIPVDGGINALR